MADTAIDKFKRIKSLKCYEQVEEMIYAGYPVSAVANFIQSRRGEYRDVKRSSLIQMLKVYRQSLKEGGMVHQTLPRVFADAEKKFSNKMQELERLEDRFQALQYRFDVLHAEERMTGEINPQVDKIDKGMRETIRQMHVIKMDLGLVGSRDLGTITVSAERIAYVKDRYGEGAAKAFAEPVSRGRVLAALNAIRRTGTLRDKDGEELDVASRLNLDEEERSQVVDVEFETADAPQAAGDDGAGEDGGEPVEGGQGPDWGAVGEDFSQPDEGMPFDEKVEALEPDPEPEEEPEREPEESPGEVKDPPSDTTEMEPVRRGHQGLPPGPAKPSVRGNAQGRWNSKKKKG